VQPKIYSKTLKMMLNMADDPTNPEGVHPITFDETSDLGINRDTGRIYWKGKEIQTKQVVSLRFYEVCLATFATIAAVGVFLIELFRLLKDVW
jgi:hypothetical protein